MRKHSPLGFWGSKEGKLLSFFLFLESVIFLGSQSLATTRHIGMPPPVQGRVGKVLSTDHQRLSPTLTVSSIIYVIKDDFKSFGIMSYVYLIQYVAIHLNIRFTKYINDK